MRSSSRAGVTLVELLIAVSLLSLLVAGILTAMRVGLNALERTNQRVIANRRAMGAQKILEQQFAGFMPVSARLVVSSAIAAASLPARMPAGQRIARTLNDCCGLPVT